MEQNCISTDRSLSTADMGYDTPYRSVLQPQTPKATKQPLLPGQNDRNGLNCPNFLNSAIRIISTFESE
jgi:hypothetical protein